MRQERSAWRLRHIYDLDWKDRRIWQTVHDRRCSLLALWSQGDNPEPLFHSHAQTPVSSSAHRESLKPLFYRPTPRGCSTDFSPIRRHRANRSVFSIIGGRERQGWLHCWQQAILQVTDCASDRTKRCYYWPRWRKVCVSNVDERLLVRVSRGEGEEVIESVSGGRERRERMRTQFFGSVEIN